MYEEATACNSPVLKKANDHKDTVETNLFNDSLGKNFEKTNDGSLAYADERDTKTKTSVYESKEKKVKENICDSEFESDNEADLYKASLHEANLVLTNKSDKVEEKPICVSVKTVLVNEHDKESTDEELAFEKEENKDKHISGKDETKKKKSDPEKDNHIEVEAKEKSEIKDKINENENDQENQFGNKGNFHVMFFIDTKTCSRKSLTMLLSILRI